MPILRIYHNRQAQLDGKGLSGATSLLQKSEIPVLHADPAVSLQLF
jgi:hypothetical protein